PLDQWQHTPWGRLLVGTLLAQGLAYGLKMLCTAGVLAAVDDPSENVWATPIGTAVWHSLQGFSLLASGALIGAGQPRAAFLGGVVGLLNSLLFLMIHHGSGEPLTELAMYGQPALHLASGALGGLLGGLVWKPLPALTMPTVSPEPRHKGRAVG